MSSDLKKPSKSIMLGTFSAVGISIVIYLTAAVVFAAVMPKETLIGDYHAMRHVAVIGWLIILSQTLEDVGISEESEVTVEPDLDKVIEQSADAAVTFLPLHVKGTLLVGPLGISFEDTLSRVLISVLVHGTYLLSSSDKNLSAEDIALGYKQLMEVERAFRMLKTTVSLRPIYHSKDERIRSHVLLCWLALLLVRIAETKTDLSWPRIRRQTQQLHLGGFLNKKSRVLRHTEPVEDQRNILRKLKVKLPALQVGSFTGGMAE
jgi:hypothetical protein